MQVVMFYAFRRPDPETAALVALLAESVRLHEPGCEVVLLTNADGARSGVPRSVRVELCDVDPEHVMVERLRLFRDHLRSVRPGTTLVFMDTDMIAIRPFARAMLAPGADLCVTVRRDPAWPINAGIIAVRTDDHPRVLALFDALLACCEGLPEKERRWYGDQVALARVLRPVAGRFRLSHVEERMGCRVRFVPGRAFNYTPRPWMLRLGVFVPGVRILHFKGARKARMALYARRYLSPVFQAYLRRRHRE